MWVKDQDIPPELLLDFRKVCVHANIYRYEPLSNHMRYRQDLRRDDSAIKTRPIYKWPK
jgi:hypothetical protein